MLNVVLLIVVVGGTILAYPCAFKRGAFREVCSKRCIQRGAFREVQSERCVKPEPPQVNEQFLFLFILGSPLASPAAAADNFLSFSVS